MDDVLSTAVEAAKAAGEIALRYFCSNLAVETKADLSPVTRADRECEAAILEILCGRFPDCGFLGEEQGGRPGRRNARWIVDPIDGTKNFIRGIPFFATLIAFEEEGDVTAGVMYAPAIDDLLYARRGCGTFGKGGQVRVSQVEELSEAMLIHGGVNGLKRRPCWQPFLELVDATGRQRGFGDALGHSIVISGHAEIALEPSIQPWDVAATKILVTEAGGRYSDFSGSPSIYTGSAVISNGHVHNQVLNILNGATFGVKK